MHPDITWLDVSNRHRSLIGYCLGMAVYALAVVAMYPAFKTSSSLDKLIASDSTAAALFGVTGPISTSSGWLNGNIYANFLPLIMLLLTIGYGASCLAGQDEDGALGLLAVLPVRRTAIVTQKAAAMAAQAALLTITVAALVITGRSFQLNVTVSREQPDQRRRQPRRLRGPDRHRPVRTRRGHPRIPPRRHPLTRHPPAAAPSGLRLGYLLQQRRRQRRPPEGSAGNSREDRPPGCSAPTHQSPRGLSEGIPRRFSSRPPGMRSCSLAPDTAPGRARRPLALPAARTAAVVLGAFRESAYDAVNLVEISARIDSLALIRAIADKENARSVRIINLFQPNGRVPLSGPFVIRDLTTPPVPWAGRAGLRPGWAKASCRHRPTRRRGWPGPPRGPGATQGP